MPNYFVYRRDEFSPAGFLCRGTAALIRRDLVHDELEQLPFTLIRTVGVYAPGTAMRIYVAYQPPGSDFAEADIR